MSGVGRASASSPRSRALKLACIIALVVASTVSCAPAVLPTTRPLVATQPAATRPLAGDAATAAVMPEEVYVPTTIRRGEPVPVLLAVHGMGGNGQRLRQRLAECAERNGW